MESERLWGMSGGGGGEGGRGVKKVSRMARTFNSANSGLDDELDALTITTQNLIPTGIHYFLPSQWPDSGTIFINARVFFCARLSLPRVHSCTYVHCDGNNGRQRRKITR